MAIKSAIGAATNIPSMPKEIGKIIISGIKHTISRTSEVKTAKTGFPDAWKKIDETLIAQVKVTSDRNIRKVFLAKSQ